MIALPAREARGSFGMTAFAVLALVAAVPVVWNCVPRRVSGGTPLSPDDVFDAADRAFSEEGDGAPRAQPCS